MSSERWAHDFIGMLLERGGLELTTKASRDSVETRIAFTIESGVRSPAKIAAVLIELPGVAEVEADDDLIAEVLAATRPTSLLEEGPTPAPAESPIQAFDVMRYDPVARAVLVRTQKLADEMRYGEVTSKHLLVALLENAGLVALAKKNGGKPDRAAVLASMPAGKATTPAVMSEAVLRVLRAAEDSVPTLVRIGDLAIAGIHLDALGFHEAFRSSVVKPTPSSIDIDSGDDDEDDDGEALVLSTAFLEAFRLAAAIARERGERWPAEPKRPGDLVARAIRRAELELETSLPDDFWAAVAAGIEPFAALGIARKGPHNDPAPLEEAHEYVLETASDADVADDLVALAELPSGGHICAHKGVRDRDRNRRSVVLLRNDIRREALFGPLLLELLREAHEATKPGPSPTFEPRLV